MGEYVIFMGEFLVGLVLVSKLRNVYKRYVIVYLNILVNIYVK